MPRVFISYSRHDRDFVRKLAADLERRRIDVFYDQLITPGESWADSLARAIEEARFLLVVLSPDFVSSPWTKEETKIGLLREAEGKARVIPLMARQVELPELLKDKTYADFTQNYEEGLERVVRALRSDELDEDPRSPGSVRTDSSAAEITRLRDELREDVASFKAVDQKSSVLPEPPNDGRRRCFIVMPFGSEELDVVFEDFVRPVIADQCGLACERGDDVFGSNIIMDDIRTSIDRADIVVADLTGKNANVFYEVGIAHTIGKPVLLLAQSMDDVPFDLRHRRVLLYEYSPRGCKKLERNLRDNLTAMLSKM